MISEGAFFPRRRSAWRSEARPCGEVNDRLMYRALAESLRGILDRG
jgi:hypothetical protein